jgi:lipoprotein-releasing system permease protein
MRPILLIAGRYAFSRQNRHRSTSIRIALGLAVCLFAINLVIAFMQALQANQFEDIRLYDSYDLQVPIPGTSLEDGADLARRIASIEDVEAAFLYAKIPVLVVSDDGQTFAGMLRAVQKDSPFWDHVRMLQGSKETDGTIYPSYLHGSVRYGDTVSVTLLKAGKQAVVIPVRRELEVGGIFYTPMYQFDEQTFLTDLPTIMALNPDSPLYVGVYANGNLSDVVDRIGAIDQTLEPMTWIEANAALYGAMELEQSMMEVLLFLMIFVIVLHVKNSSKRLLLAKQREIAMLRSMGFRLVHLQAVFVLQSVIVAAIGVACGVGLSYLGIWLYPYLSDLVAPGVGGELVLQIRGMRLLVLVAVVFAFSMVASWLGTRKILKADIMEMFGHDEIQ